MNTNTFNTVKELKDGIKSIRPHFFKSSKAMGIYAFLKVGNAGRFIEVANVFNDNQTYVAVLKHYDADQKQIRVVRKIESTRHITKEEARQFLLN